MLISTSKGVLNTDHIISVVPERGGAGNILRLSDGTDISMSAAEARNFERACGTIVPAGPGLDLVTAIPPCDVQVHMAQAGLGGIVWNSAEIRPIP